MTAHQLRGDARRLPLASGSVQCIVTSPPYFGLRSYGGQTSVWGGDPECPHTLADDPVVKPMTSGTGPTSGKQTSNKGSQFGNAWAEEGKPKPAHRNGQGSHGLQDHGPDNHSPYLDTLHTAPPTTGATCTLCGAWRGELGSEPTPALFVAHMVEVMRECKRVLRDDGVCFVNMGDSYAGSGKGPSGHNGIGDQGQRQGFTGNGGMHRKRLEAGAIGNAWVPAPKGHRQKSLLLVPERLAIALSDDGWIVRQVLVWSKNNPMPESVRDRWTTAHEYVLMLVKQPRYFFDQVGIAEPAEFGRCEGTNWKRPREADPRDGRQEQANTVVPGKGGTRNGRSVWEISTDPYRGAHYAVFPRDLVRRCVAAASREGDVVLDPFSGSGTTAFVAASMGRVGVGVELSAEYTEQARYGRLAQEFLPLTTEAPQAPATPARTAERPVGMFDEVEVAP